MLIKSMIQTIQEICPLQLFENQYFYVWHLVCTYERTNYDGNTAFDNPMNSKTRGVSKAVCKSWCNGEKTYTHNSKSNSPKGSKCEYMKWRSTTDGGACSLYNTFQDAHAWHRGSPGNLYRRNCVDAAWKRHGWYSRVMKETHGISPSP